MADASTLKLPHRAEHIGSLLRPRELRDAFKAHAAGRMNNADYREIEDRNIIEAIRMQEGVGLATISDGEFPRGSWAFGLVKAVEGFGEARSMFEFHDAAGNSYPFDTCYAVAKIRRNRPIAVGEFEFVRRHTQRVPKVTIPAPSSCISFAAKLAPIRLFTPTSPASGPTCCACITKSLPSLAAQARSTCKSTRCRSRCSAIPRCASAPGRSARIPTRWSPCTSAASTTCLVTRPIGMTVGMHLCRGNLRSRWMAAGSYEAVAERLFNDVEVDAFFLEYDTPRAGDFAPLRFMAKDKTVVLGLISTKTPVLEDADALCRRIDEAARYVPLERLALSPQCGFASTVGGNLLSIDDERRKLGLVVDVAKRVWG